MEQNIANVMLALPIWYFQSVFFPSKIDSIPLVAIRGVVSLIIGLLLGYRKSA